MLTGRRRPGATLLGFKTDANHAAAAMLTCDICGEETLLAEDMKTHLLLSHAESEVRCPLCSLSGVSHDELRFHISSAHPEGQWSPAPAAGPAESSEPRFASPSYSTPTGHSAVTALVRPKQSAAPERGCSSVRRSKGDGGDGQHIKAKQKRLSLTSEEEQFSCPMCALVCSSCDVLQEHVELHLQEQCLPEEETRLRCPVCSVVCSDSVSLQEHVELHLDHGTAGNYSAGVCSSDLELARQLQQQEEEQRPGEEQEEREFKKLQRQFGLDGTGGYRRQMERTMERAVARGLMAPADFHCKRAEMMESLASGVDDGRTRTRGVVRALYEYYQTDSRDRDHVWLSADTDHFCSSAGDKGWGCGYRNLQMLLSSLHGIDAYSPVLTDKAVPSLPRLQSMTEAAWEEGLDPQGASHFNQRLLGTRAWIGATEIYSLLTSLRISASIIDFHQPTGPGDTHPQLFDWVKQYFCQSSSSSSSSISRRLPPRLIQTRLPPLYLQHQGHSRSIVGLEQKKNGSHCLLVLDPGSSASDARKLLSRDTVSAAVRHVRRFPSSLKHKQYQVVAVRGVLSAEEKQMSILNSRTLCAERIP
ncbi:zinc finger-containing ubiquitin peptidase 1 isoform X2 [Scophthalmus maximus]|uniref:zinc finger-containing ubiquitin peptidase 1 isoform X2 n=1 Tax=Scophthalmus maximus TaxID=52904 RepID=UPI001FA8235C|nr:zinc finger-containing ubiquitin peptidase 1 isoform X2 [Scophthalmus maximus]